MTVPQAFPIIDFHNHHVPERFTPTTALSGSAANRERWLGINRKLADEALLLQDIDSGDIDGRVVNIPASLLADGAGELPADTYRAINDSVAELVARHPGKLHGLASIDAYAGDEGAREVERAVGELKLRGLFVDSGRGEWLIDADVARPTLEAAAQFGVPVFVHPVNPSYLTAQLAPYGRVGTLFARGTINAAALIALVEGDVLRSLPGLQVVVTTLAIGGLALDAAFGGLGREDAVEARSLLRERVHIDTMGFSPALIRAAVDLLGADRVVVGSDWPIVNDKPIRGVVTEALAAAGLSGDEQALVAAGNARRLLHLDD